MKILASIYLVESFTWIPIKILYVHGHFKEYAKKKPHLLLIKLPYWAWVTCGLICQTILTLMQSGGFRDVSYFCNFKIWLKSCVFCGLMRKFARDWHQWWKHSFSIDDVDEDGDHDDDDYYYYYYYYYYYHYYYCFQNC